MDWFDRIADSGWLPVLGAAALYLAKRVVDWFLPSGRYSRWVDLYGNNGQHREGDDHDEVDGVR